MPKLRHILLDESPFVFLTRNDLSFSLKAELARFLEKCIRRNAHREYHAYATYIAQQRLGYGWMYKVFKSLTRNKERQAAYQKRLARRVVAKSIIVRFLDPKKFRLPPHSWQIMDLHLFANENKREALGRPLLPAEVIPLDMCETALLAHDYNLPLFSFHKDYEYFIQIPGIKNSFIQYWKPEDILKNMPV